METLWSCVHPHPSMAIFDDTSTFHIHSLFLEVANVAFFKLTFRSERATITIFFYWFLYKYRERLLL